MATSKIPVPYSRTASGYKGGTDADDYLTTGFYHVGISSNSPTGSTVYGMLIVWAGAGYVAQLYIGNSGVYARTKPNASDPFASWLKLN